MPRRYVISRISSGELRDHSTERKGQSVVTVDRGLRFGTLRVFLILGGGNELG